MGFSDAGNCTFRPPNDNTGLHPVYSAGQAVSRQKDIIHNNIYFIDLNNNSILNRSKNFVSPSYSLRSLNS